MRWQRPIEQDPSVCQSCAFQVEDLDANVLRIGSDTEKDRAVIMKSTASMGFPS
jgi:hypothetical protein